MLSIAEKVFRCTEEGRIQAMQFYLCNTQRTLELILKHHSSETCQHYCDKIEFCRGRINL